MTQYIKYPEEMRMDAIERKVHFFKAIDKKMGTVIGDMNMIFKEIYFRDSAIYKRFVENAT